jgi:hypothetical protein
MSIWDSYPDNYRTDEVHHILQAVNAGECVSIVGLSGAGKSNLMGFLAHRVTDGPAFHLVDCNDLVEPDAASLLGAIAHSLDESQPQMVSISTLIQLLQKMLKASSSRICILLDRFDLFQLDQTAGKTLANNLRALRDRFKYDLTYVISTRRPLDPASELTELFFANTLWLGPLNRENSRWSINQFATRHTLNWSSGIVEEIYNCSNGYPSLLRAVCEAHASGTPLDLNLLSESPAVKRRVSEFWADEPEELNLINSKLKDLPLLFAAKISTRTPNELTSSEHRLMDYFAAHQGVICSKEELMTVVWPEEKLVAGLRDDSLTQLVHRLREKVDPAGTNCIQTIPGRGYRYLP